MHNALQWRNVVVASVPCPPPHFSLSALNPLDLDLIFDPLEFAIASHQIRLF